MTKPVLTNTHLDLANKIRAFVANNPMLVISEWGFDEDHPLEYSIEVDALLENKKRRFLIFFDLANPSDSGWCLVQWPIDDKYFISGPLKDFDFNHITQLMVNP